MKIRRLAFLAAGSLPFFVSACNDDPLNPSQDLACPVVVRDADCDKTLLPMVFVHGTFGSGDNFSNVAALLASNGYCPDRLIAIDYNSIGAEDPAQNGKIDAAIDKVLAATHLGKVELLGHSLGTRWSQEYLKDPAHAAKVAHYINLSGDGAIPNDVPTLSISSKKDLLGVAHHPTGTHVTQVTFEEADHIGVAFSNQTFVEIYKYLRNAEPEYTEIQCGEESITIEGVAEALGDNTRVAGRAELYEMGDVPREHGATVQANSADADGHFGPFQLKRNVAYELKGFDETGKLVGYQYFSPFRRSNRLVRLLVPPRDAGFAAATTDHFVRTPEQVDVVLRSTHGAFRMDLGDQITIDGKEILTPQNAPAPPALPTVGLFAYDANSNGQTDLGPAFSSPFIMGTDVFMDASKPKFILLQAGDRKVKISNWPASEALISVLFQ